MVRRPKPQKKNKPSARNKSEDKKPSARKPRGAPPGTKNARGNSGGAPKGNTNALKHGGYSAIFWDTLSDDEKEMIDTMEHDEEQLLIDEINLLTVRERRIMQSIAKYKDSKSGQAVRSIYTSEHKRRFTGTEEEKANDEDLYARRMREKVEANI